MTQSYFVEEPCQYGKRFRLICKCGDPQCNVVLEYDPDPNWKEAYFSFVTPSWTFWDRVKHVFTGPPYLNGLLLDSETCKILGDKLIQISQEIKKDN
jgi:hypothetical protein